MSDLLVRPQDRKGLGLLAEVTPRSAGWRCVGFQSWRLAAGQTFAGGEAGREACVVALSGRIDVFAGGETFANLGGRDTVFTDAAPAAVLIPAGGEFRVTAATAAEVAVCTAPGWTKGAPRRIAIAGGDREVRGEGANQRFVRDILPASEAADSLLVVEVITPGGHWSSYPPHKHDTAEAGRETALEETYYHRLRPEQGFAFQRVYTDDRALDETFAVEDGDIVLVPRGYHPVAAAHGYDLYYLNVMAGPERRWIFRNDPAHDWIAPKPPPSAPTAKRPGAP